MATDYESTIFERRQAAKGLRERLFAEGELLVRVRDGCPNYDRPTPTAWLVFRLKVSPDGQGFGIVELGETEPRGGWVQASEQDTLRFLSDLEITQGRLA